MTCPECGDQLKNRYAYMQHLLAHANEKFGVFKERPKPTYEPLTPMVQSPSAAAVLIEALYIHFLPNGTWCHTQPRRKVDSLSQWPSLKAVKR